MKKKIVMAISIIILLVVGVRVFNVIEHNKQVKLDREWEEQKQKEKNEEIEEIKREATRADFVELNAGKIETIAKKVFIEGEVSFIETKTIPKSFTLTSKEGDGFGMYNITFYDEEISNTIKEGDMVKVFGLHMGKSNLGMPRVTCEAIENL